MPLLTFISSLSTRYFEISTGNCLGSPIIYTLEAVLSKGYKFTVWGTLLTFSKSSFGTKLADSKIGDVLFKILFDLSMFIYILTGILKDILVRPLSLCFKMMSPPMYLTILLLQANPSPMLSNRSFKIPWRFLSSEKGMKSIFYLSG